MARDIFHDTVREALIADGWTITHDPFPLAYGDQNLYVDLGAEQMLAAERSGKRIAVEVKSFVGRSAVRDLQLALGQYLMYQKLIEEHEPTRLLYLAVSRRVFESYLRQGLGQFTLESFDVRLLIFDEFERRVHRWID